MRSLMSIAVFATLISAGAQAATRALEPKDLFHMQWAADPQIRKDGALIAYARAEGADTVVLSRQLEAPSLVQRLELLTADNAREVAPPELTLEFVSGDEQWTEESALSLSPVNIVDAAATRALGSALRAGRLLTTMGVGLLVAALLLAGAAMWGLLPLPSMVGAIVLGLSGGVMVASARPKAHLE